MAKVAPPAIIKAKTVKTGAYTEGSSKTVKYCVGVAPIPMVVKVLPIFGANVKKLLSSSKIA